MGRLISFNKDSFSKGQFDNTILDNEGSITLSEHELEGTYVSPKIETKHFTELVASWNCFCAGDTSLELSFKLKVDGNWSKWFSYGKWTEKNDRGSIKGQDDIDVKMSVDTIIVKDNKQANSIQYKLVIRRGDISLDSPSIRRVMASLKLENIEESILDDNVNYLVDLDVPARSQMVVPEIGRVICSPTSVAMIMEYLGTYVPTEEAAEMVKDNNSGMHGNWSFNVAYAGSKGFTAYVDRFTNINDLKLMIANGQPVILSIKTDSVEELTGSPMKFPYGHLLVARGFTERDGKEYVIVNDPSAPDHDQVRKEYDLVELENVWRKVVYIIKK